MRQQSIILFLISLIIFGTQTQAFPAVKGGIEYSIPVDYSKLSESELEKKADRYFYLAQQYNDEEKTESLTDALMLYTVLQNINPNNIKYCIRLGILYDKLKLDKYAKGNLSRAIGINSDDAEPYFYFGEFYYKRQQYRKALKYYNEAYSRGYSSNYDMLYRMGDIYEKFGDTHSSLKYLKEASIQSHNPELNYKIRSIESKDAINKEYYSSTRIRHN